MKKTQKIFSRLSTKNSIKNKQSNRATKVFSSGQQKFMTTFSEKADMMNEASFLVAYTHAHTKQSYSDGDLFYFSRT